MARLLVTAVIAGATALAVALLVASPAGLFTGDEGIKLAETQGLAFSGYRDAALYDPGAQFGSELRPFAAKEEFTFTGDDPVRRYGTYPLLYPALAAPLYRIGGLRGAAVVSLVGFVLTLLLTARLARRCGLTERAAAVAVAIVGLASAMPLYATTLFEHTAGTAALLGAIDAVLARRFALGGVLLGLATCFRTELYAFAPAMAIVIAWQIGVARAAWPRWLGFGGAALAVVVAFLIAHRLATPAWHPTLTASGDAEVPSLHRRLGQLLAYELVNPGWILAVATFAVGIARSLGMRPRAVVIAIIAAAWAVVTGLAIRDIADSGDIRAVTGLVTTTPVIVLALVDGVRRDGTPLGALVGAATCFAVTVVVLPKAAAAGGLELGARYLLPTVPLFAIGAVAVARRGRIEQLCVAVLATLGLAVTVVDARAQWQIRELGANIVAAAGEGGAVFTPVWWVAQLAVPAQGDGTSLFVGEKATAVYDRLYAAGVRRIVALRGPAPDAVGRIRLRLLPASRTRDGRLVPRVYELVEPAVSPGTSGPTP